MGKGKRPKKSVAGRRERNMERPKARVRRRGTAASVALRREDIYPWRLGARATCTGVYLIQMQLGGGEAQKEAAARRRSNAPRAKGEHRHGWSTEAERRHCRQIVSERRHCRQIVSHHLGAVLSCISYLMERLDAAGAKGTQKRRTLGHHIAGQRIAGLHHLTGRHEYHTLLAPPGRLVSGVSCTRVVRI